MRNLFFQYSIFSLIVVSMIVLSVSFIMGASQVLHNTERRQMENVIESVSVYMSYSRQSDNFDWKEESIAIRTIAGAVDVYLVICDRNGKIIHTPDPFDQSREMYLPQSVLSLCSNGQDIPANIMPPEIPETSQAFISRAILQNGRTEGYILTASLLNNYRSLMDDFVRIWVSLGVFILLFAGLGAFFISRRMVRPLHQMASCAHTFAHGDFSVRVDTKKLGDGETLKLAVAFNTMADALQKGEDLRRGFIANISHELKTPMTTIAGFIGGILDGTIPPEKHGQTHTLVYDEIMRLSRLVISMTNLTHLQTGQLDLRRQPFNISETSVRILFGFENKINDKNLNVSLDIAVSEELFVFADPDSIIQVLTNLIDNAIKFAYPDTDLLLKIRSKNGKAHISITNCGQRIPPEDLPYIFDRFYKTDRSRSHDRSGLGLGLFLARSILYAHNEDICISSNNGITVASFTLSEAKPPKHSREAQT